MSQLPCPFRHIDALTPILAWPDPTGFDAFRAYWWGTLARSSYETDGTLPLRALRDHAPTTGFHFRAPGDSSLAPGFFWGLQGGQFVLVIGGTTNNAQWLFQVLTHAFDLQTTVAGFAVNAAFANAGAVVANAVGADFAAAGSPPLLVVGHSLGAAAGAVAFAILRPGASLADDRLVSLGAPRYGNNLMADYFRDTQQTRLSNLGDPVVFLPPPQNILRLVGLAFPGAVLAAGNYRHNSPAQVLHGAQGVEQLDEQGLSAREWIQETFAFVTGGAMAEPHFARAYVGQLFDWQRAEGGSPTTAFADYPDLHEVNRLLTEGGL